MSPSQLTRLANALGLLADGLDQAGAVLHEVARDAPATTEPTAPDLGQPFVECGCSPTARCNVHEVTRRKGCGCNGPYASSECSFPEHRDQAAKWPAGDPALVQ